MKIGNSAENILVTNVDTGNRGKFGIQATGKAFWILSNALYQHKVRAVVREVGCNAYDAHISAGNTATPFSVSLPTVKDPHFRVRDFGIGLAPDKFIEIYTTYFGSTKSESNDETGGLGLGSKTPFIMSKSFTVHSYYNGMDYMWHSFVNDNGEPDVMLLNEKPTTEPNGLLVIVPVGHGISDTERNALFREFVTEAKNIYQWFDVLPNVTSDGEKVEIISRLHGPDTVYTELAVTGVGANTRVYYHKDQPATSQSNSVLVKMGNVVYPYNVSETRNLDRFGGNIIHTEALLKYITQTGRLNPKDDQLVIEVAMGDVDFAPSREALSLNNTTELTIINSIVRFMTLFAQHIQKEIDAATDTFTRYDYLYRVVPIPNTKFKIDGKEVSPADQRPSWAFVQPGDEATYQDKVLRMFKADQFGIRYRRAGTRGLNRYERSFEEKMYGRDMRSRTIVLIDKAYKGELRLWINANVAQGDAVVVLTQPDGRSPLTQQDMEPFLVDKHPQVKLLSQMKAPVIVTKPTAATKKVTTEVGLQMNYTNTRYNYFTQGNGVTVKIADILEFDPDSPKVYVAFQKKGASIQTRALEQDPATQAWTSKMVEIATWSRGSGRYSTVGGTGIAFDLIRNWPAEMQDADFEINFCPDGVTKYNIDVVDSQQVHQLVMTKEAYEEFVDKPEYPHIMSLEGWVNKVLLPSMPTHVSSTAVSDLYNDHQFEVYSGGGGAEALFKVLNIESVVGPYQRSVEQRSHDSSSTVRNMTNALENAGFQVPTANYTTTTYYFTLNNFQQACLSAVAKGILPPPVHNWIGYMTANFTKDSTITDALTTGYYRASRTSVEVLQKTLGLLLLECNFNSAAFANHLVQHYDDTKVIS